MSEFKERMCYECHVSLRLNTSEWHWYCPDCGQRQKYYPGEAQAWSRYLHARQPVKAWRIDKPGDDDDDMTALNLQDETGSQRQP